jgi:hypothetical protein
MRLASLCNLLKEQFGLEAESPCRDLISRSPSIVGMTETLRAWGTVWAPSPPPNHPPALT